MFICSNVERPAIRVGDRLDGFFPMIVSPEDVEAPQDNATGFIDFGTSSLRQASRRTKLREVLDLDNEPSKAIRSRWMMIIEVYMLALTTVLAFGWRLVKADDIKLRPHFPLLQRFTPCPCVLGSSGLCGNPTFGREARSSIKSFTRSHTNGLELSKILIFVLGIKRTVGDLYGW